MELVKKQTNFIYRNTNASVSHGKSQQAIGFLPLLFQGNSDLNLSAAGELHGIAGQIRENLTDAARIAAKEAGNEGDSYYYMSFYYVMYGDLKMAAAQLQLALELPGLDAIQRARFSARLDEIKAAMPKDRKNTVAEDNGGNGRH